MWTMLFFLWLVPIGIGTVVFARVVDGRAPLEKNERQLFFDERKKTQLGFWLGIRFGLLALFFFVAGLVQGIILPNLSGFWLVAVPVLTGTAAVVLLALCLRSQSPRSPRLRGSISRIQTRAARIAEDLFR